MEVERKLTDQQIQNAFDAWLDAFSSRRDVIEAIAPHVQYQRQEVPAKIERATWNEAQAVWSHWADNGETNSVTSLMNAINEELIDRRNNPPKEDPRIEIMRHWSIASGHDKRIGDEQFEELLRRLNALSADGKHS